jgi:hypothetical protein
VRACLSRQFAIVINPRSCWIPQFFPDLLEEAGHKVNIKQRPRANGIVRLQLRCVGRSPASAGRITCTPMDEHRNGSWLENPFHSLSKPALSEVEGGEWGLRLPLRH